MSPALNSSGKSTTQYSSSSDTAVFDVTAIERRSFFTVRYPPEMRCDRADRSRTNTIGLLSSVTSFGGGGGGGGRRGQNCF